MNLCDSKLCKIFIFQKRKLDEEERDKLASDGKNKVEKFLKSENSIATKKSMAFTATTKMPNEPSTSASSSSASQNDKSKNFSYFVIFLHMLQPFSSGILCKHTAISDYLKIIFGLSLKYLPILHSLNCLKSDSNQAFLSV